LKKKGEAWRLVEPESREVEETVVNGLLSTLADLEADRILGEVLKDSVNTGLESMGLDRPEIEITVKNEEREVLGTLFISEKGPEGDPQLYYAKPKQDDWIGLLGEKEKNQLTEKLAVFFEKNTES